MAVFQKMLNNNWDPKTTKTVTFSLCVHLAQQQNIKHLEEQEIIDIPDNINIFP